MKANKFLKEKDIEFELVEQDNPTKNCDDAAEERGIETSQIVKSLIVRKGDDYYHVCIPGDRKLSEKRFGEHRMADPETSKEITDQESGTVHPFASDLKHYIDERVFEKDRVSFTIGHVKKAVIIDSDSFRKALDKTGFEYEVEDLVVVTPEEIEKLKEAGLEEEKAKFISEAGYRSIFNELSGDYELKMLVKLFMELDRHELKLGPDTCREMLDSAENETNLQKIIEYYAENNSIPEDKGFSLEDVIEQVIDGNPDAVEDYNEGRDSAVNYLMGQVMQRSQGRVDPETARKQLMAELE